jgi:hypothetical protein
MLAAEIVAASLLCLPNMCPFGVYAHTCLYILLQDFFGFIGQDGLTISVKDKATGSEAVIDSTRISPVEIVSHTSSSALLSRLQESRPGFLPTEPRRVHSLFGHLAAAN